MCGRRDGPVEGGGGITSWINSQSLLVFSGDGEKKREREREVMDGVSLRADVHDKCHLLHNIVRVMHIVPAAFLHILKIQHRQFLVLVYPQTVY